MARSPSPTRRGSRSPSNQSSRSRSRHSSGSDEPTPRHISVPSNLKLVKTGSKNTTSSTMTIEEQLREKFLSDPAASEPKSSIKKVPSKKIGFLDNARNSVKENLFVGMAEKVVKLNEGANTFRKTVQMAGFTTVEISDSGSEYSSDESYNTQRKTSRRTNFSARRPSMNPALFNISSSSSYESSSDDDDDNVYHTKRFSKSSSDEEEEDEDQLKFKRMLRKTLISRRNTMKSIRASQTSRSTTDSNSTTQRPMGLKKFKAAANTIKLGQQFVRAAAENLKDEDDTLKESRESRLTREEETTEIPYEQSINEKLLRQRRDGFHADNFAEQKLRNQLELLMEGNENQNAFVIHPYSKFRFRWDIATVIVILCNVITIPLEFSFFDGKPDLNMMKAVTDIWFTVDMMLTFRTGFLNNNAASRKNVIMDPREIRRSYVRSWFVIDFLATFPFDMVFNRVAGMVETTDVDKFSSYMKVTRILKILKLMRLFRFGRLVRYLHHWEEILSMDYGTGENAIKGVLWLAGMLFICHWNACILYLVPQESTVGKPPNGTFYGPKDSYTYSWFYIEGFQMDSKTTTQKYFWCLFKSMSHMLTIGYGVNTPHVMADVWTSIFVMFVGALTFALFLSQLISMVDQLKITATKFKRHIREVDDYLKFNRCPLNLKKAVKEFYDFHYRQRIFDEEMIFAELNPILLDDVTTCGIIEYIEDCDLFRSCRSDLQRHLCRLFKVEMYQPYTNIVLSGRLANKFSIIRQGVITVEADNARRGHYYHLEEGDSFGLEAFANVSHPRYVTTALSETWVEVLQMDIKKFVQFGIMNPEYRDDLKLIDTIANQQLRQSGHFAQIANKQREIKLFFG